MVKVMSPADDPLLAYAVLCVIGLIVLAVLAVVVRVTDKAGARGLTAFAKVLVGLAAVVAAIAGILIGHAADDPPAGSPTGHAPATAVVEVLDDS